MEQILIEIPNPLEYIEFVGKRINKKTGKVKTTKYYLTANLFYSTLNHFVQKEILEKVKWFLHPHMSSIPVLDDFPIQIELKYYNTKTTYDVDNKLYFWNKVICDKLAQDGKIPNDNVKYISKLTFCALYGEPKLVIVINTL